MRFSLVATASLLILLPLFSEPVDRGKFRTCDQSGFCKRQRNVQEDTAQYQIDFSTAKEHDNKILFDVVNENNGVRFKLELIVLADNTFRLKMNEANPIYPRYEVEHALLKEFTYAKYEVTKATNYWIVKSGKNEVHLFGATMKIEFYADGELVTVINGRHTLKFEHLRTKPDPNDQPPADDEAQEGKENALPKEESEPSMWEESFGGNTDSKPRGPESIGVDIDFPHTQNIYGIPEHADSFALRDTRSGDPYRLYNLDVFEYEVDNVMAIYGAVPYIIAHSEKRTVGVLWLNAAETWVDVGVSSGGLVDSIVNLVGGVYNTLSTSASYVLNKSKQFLALNSSSSRPPNPTQPRGAEENIGKTRWMSESGILDITVFLGPKPADVIRQFAKLSGTTPLPQMWAIASHQCRWNYNDEEDVRTVDENFDKYDIPYDSLWLDIEHTDGKKYFTWDGHKFPHSVEMIQNISAKGRKMVTIVDPHIKRESGYFVHEDALSQDLYVKDRNGKVYEGWCWPGSSSYLDFFDPRVQEYWANAFALDKYVGSTLDLYTWNDMNEPSVFNGPEITMPKDMVHHGGWEHRDVHNLYGFMQVMATYNGHIQRSGGQLRPFILTRSHFVGAQRYAAVWTGDNMANWAHLKASIPMCLSLSISGITHCGADIGGFFHNPEPELMLRWYQAAMFQPFVRNHAHIETKRREPWVFGDHMVSLIRSAVRKRYALLPYWYTLFYENEQTGAPPMRPMWYDFPEDQKAFRTQDQHLVGSALLVHPVTDPGIKSVSVYFPAGTWYDFYNYNPHYSNGESFVVPVGEDTIPVFQRGGTIIPTKQRIRRASSLMKNDPYTLYVALSSESTANGSLYIDDGESFQYRKGNYLEVKFTFEHYTLKATVQNPSTDFKTVEWIERIVFLGLPQLPTSIEGTSKSLGTVKLEGEGDLAYVIRKPKFLVNEDWMLKLRTN